MCVRKRNPGEIYHFWGFSANSRPDASETDHFWGKSELDGEERCGHGFGGAGVLSLVILSDLLQSQL
jgi:hypothetical protein